MSRIRSLDPHVVNQIAAGEVVERPASVVKELLENSLDALATRVEVDVAAGGTELIRVTDDGEGIAPDDLPLALASHATSKIASAEELFRVRTLGFRGEALASIAAVSRLSVRSRRADSQTGAQIEVDCGQTGPVEPCGCPAGTRVEVRRLFAGVPVRRRFLRATATEFGHVVEQFTRIALAHPRLHMVLRHNEKLVHELPASPQLIERLRLFYGAELAENLIWIESQSGDVKLWGYVARPSHSRSTRRGQYLFVGGRWIQDRSLQHALGEAYRGLLMTGRYPIAFLFLEMPPELVDVNVHPTKAEVRFRDGQALYRQLLSTLRTKFLTMDLDGTMRLPGAGRKPDEPSPVDPARQRELERELADWAREQLANWKPPAPDEPLVTEESGPVIGPDEVDEVHSAAGAAVIGEADANRRIALHDDLDIKSFDDLDRTAERSQGEPVRVDSDHSPVPRDPSGGPAQAGSTRVMQIHDCYLVVETEDGLSVIDQHALHERVMYEQLRRRVLDGAVESQRMLVPQTLELGGQESAVLLENRGLLAEMGFEIEEFGGGTLLLTAYPTMLRRADPARIIHDVAGQLLEAGSKPTRRDLLDRLLHMLSCKAAIKAGQRLAPEEINSLLAYRHLIDDAHHCPHGRPTALKLSRAELDRQFGRMG